MKCECVVLNREDDEEQREWLKRWMCQYHWMQTDYYQAKLRDIADRLDHKATVEKRDYFENQREKK